MLALGPNTKTGSLANDVGQKRERYRVADELAFLNLG